MISNNANASSAKQPQLQQTILTVVSKQYITSHYLSIIFHSDEAMLFKNIPLGEHNKIFIPQGNEKDIIIPTIDFATHKWIMPENSIPPKVRTYTHRAIDLDAKTMTIDFAVHEGESVACRWAINAKPGDKLGMMMKLQSKPILPLERSTYLFVADPTAIPVTAVYLSQLPKNSKAIVIAEVFSEADHYPFQTQAEVDIHWVYNQTPKNGSKLSDFLISHPSIKQIKNNRFAHIAAEFTTVKKARSYLRETLGWSREECYATSYWQIGREEGDNRKGD